MTIPVSALEVSKCYLTKSGRVWRIIQRMPDGRVLYEHRAAADVPAASWKPGMLTALPAEVKIEREVPCDWTPSLYE